MQLETPPRRVLGLVESTLYRVGEGFSVFFLGSHGHKGLIVRKIKAANLECLSLGNKSLALAQGLLRLGKVTCSHRAPNPRTSSELLAHYTLQFPMARQSHPASWVTPVLTRLC